MAPRGLKRGVIMYFTAEELNNKLKAGHIFTHFKGNQYALLHYACDHTNGNTPTPVVVYANLNPSDNRVFVRDIREFFSPVDKEKYPDVTQTFRFEVASGVM